MGSWFAWVLVGCVGMKPSAPSMAQEEAPRPAEERGEPLTHMTTRGLLSVHPVRHGTLYLRVEDQVIWVDPVGELEGSPPGNVVLVTDVHRDHLDPEALRRVMGPEAVVVAPLAVATSLSGDVHVAHPLANGESLDLGGLGVEAVAMYNHTRGPEPGRLYHDPGRGNGYVLTIGQTRIYIAGDTACTEEMRLLRDIDHAFVPMNLPYTMPPDEAAACVRAFAPRRVTPYHYRGSDLGRFEAALVGTGIAVELAEFYPEAAPLTSEER